MQLCDIHTGDKSYEGNSKIYNKMMKSNIKGMTL